jgi:hypothetical protein
MRRGCGHAKLIGVETRRLRSRGMLSSAPAWLPAVSTWTLGMNDLELITHQLNSVAHYTTTIAFDGTPGREYVDLFDQSGYDLSELEKLYAAANGQAFHPHRENRHAIRTTWLESPPEKMEGAVLNHALLLERKGFRGAALEQLETWAQVNPLLYKLVKYRPKWGLDFSMDYADRNGNVIEVLHFEYDGFDFDEIQARVDRYTDRFLAIDWDFGGRRVLARIDDWIHLGFHEQSDWKCDYFGIEHERFKLVAWDR